MKISLDLLAMLDAIDRYGSFTAAAAALHRVPSALSHAVAKLEADLDTPLFTRHGRKATLNAAGHALIEDGRHLLRSARQLERRVQRIAHGWEAELRIAVDQIIPVARLYPLLERFYGEGHTTQLHLSCEVLGGTWDALTTERADLAIGAPGDRPPASGIATRFLCMRSDFVFAIAPGHPLAACPEPIPNSELQRHRAVVIADTSRELDARTIGLLEGQDALRVPTMDAKAQAQIAGLGIGHLPRWMAAPALEAGLLVERQLQESRPPMPCHVAWRIRDKGRAAEWFIAALAENGEIERLTAGL